MNTLAAPRTSSRAADPSTAINPSRALRRTRSNAPSRAVVRSARSASNARLDAVVNGTPGDLGKIFLALDEFAAQKIDEEYSDDGSVHIQILCDEGVVEMLKQRLANTTSGRTEFKYWAR